jgi:hypothetical protein
MIIHNFSCSKETDFLEQNLSGEITSYSTGQEIPYLLWNPVINAEMTRARHWTLICICHINPVNTQTP